MANHQRPSLSCDLSICGMGPPHENLDLLQADDGELEAESFQHWLDTLILPEIGQSGSLTLDVADLTPVSNAAQLSTWRMDSTSGAPSAMMYPTI